ncbi:MAG: D-aminoacyl-tRNA deacylase [Spirochaetaceae bacterium]
MRAVVQRVRECRVTVDGAVVGSIDTGALVYLGISADDGDGDISYTARKIAGLRIFDNDAGVPNRSLLDVGGSALVVSQFTLYGDTRKGRRPSYNRAAPPEAAERVYGGFVTALEEEGVPTATGAFQAHMAVWSVNDGPFTILIDSRKEF